MRRAARELRDAVAASVRAEAKEREVEARREQAKERELEAQRERSEAKLEAANDALSSERERFDAERARRPLAPAPTPGLVLFDADADATTPADAATPTDAPPLRGELGTNLLARIVRTEVAEAVESFAVDVAARAETNDRLRDAESKLEVASGGGEGRGARGGARGDADASRPGATGTTAGASADERSERADAERAERETRSAEAHERSARG